MLGDRVWLRSWSFGDDVDAYVILELVILVAFKAVRKWVAQQAAIHILAASVKLNEE